MRKLLLTFGMIFATSFMMNASMNSQTNDIVVNTAIENLTCFEQADAISTAFGYLFGMDYDSEFELFEMIWDACKASGQY